MMRDLAGQFGGKPRDSITSLLIEMGPFVPPRGALQFTNSFRTTVDQATDCIELAPKLLVQEMIDLGALGYRDALNAIRIPVPFFPDVPLPATLFASVIDTVLLELASRLADEFLDPYSRK